MKILREAVYVERTNARMTQEDVAASIGCSRKWVSRFERGLSVPDIDKVAAYAALFGIDVMMRIPVREIDLDGSGGPGADFDPGTAHVGAGRR